MRHAGKPEKSGLMAYAEIKGRCGGAKGCTEWGISADRLTRAGLNDRTASAQTGRRYSLLLRETGGTKDIKNDSYYASKIQQIDKSQWEDYGNNQGATEVIKRLVSPGSYVSRPENPTRVYRSRIINTGSSPITITLNPGESSSVAYNLVSTVYDCSTWANYYSAPTYDYVGYFASSHSSTEEKKTVLAQSGSTAMQNFAFDMGEEDL